MNYPQHKYYYWVGKTRQNTLTGWAEEWNGKGYAPPSVFVKRAPRGRECLKNVKKCLTPRHLPIGSPPWERAPELTTVFGVKMLHW